MTEQRVIIEMGMGNDLHGMDYTKAAGRAIEDALRHSSLPLFGVLALEQAYKPSAWLNAAIWLPLVIILSLVLLPRIKGMLVGLQWALRMHGFGGASLARAADVATDAPVRQTAGN